MVGGLSNFHRVVPANAGTHTPRPELLEKEDNDQRAKTITDGGYGSRLKAGTTCHPASAAFTRPLALPKSICPAYFAFKTAITLPMSFIPAAPVSATAADIAALTSSSDICFGRYAEMIAISSRSWAASSARPPLS